METQRETRDFFPHAQRVMSDSDDGARTQVTNLALRLRARKVTNLAGKSHASRAACSCAICMCVCI